METLKTNPQIKQTIEVMIRIGHQLVKKQRNIKAGDTSYKMGKEIVSKFDVETEKNIRKQIKKIWPNHKIWGEEIGKDKGDLTRENFIIIDPIDGTKNFLSGLPLFASQIACVEKGEIIWGIINLPALNEIYLAIKGAGAFLNYKRICPSNQSSLDLAMQCFGIGHDAVDFIKLPKLIKKQLAEPRHYGCAGVHYSFTANGRIDIYIAKEAGFYDLAAGILLCKEAGLAIRRLDGSQYKIDENGLGLVIANKKLMSEYIKVIKNK